MELRKGNEPVPVSEWSAILAPKQRSLGAKLLQLAADRGDSRDDLSVFVEARQISDFSDKELEGANLPAPCPFMLELNSKGSLASPTFSFELKWYRADRRRLGPVEIRGIELSTSGTRYILTQPFYSLTQAVTAFNALPKTNLDDRLGAWADICSLMGVAVDGSLRVRPDQYLQNIRVIPAHRFTLDLDVDSQNQIEIKPVLLSGRSGRSDEGVSGEQTDSPELLLSPEQQERFAKTFSDLSPGRTKYPIGDGTYVIFDDSLAEALTQVRHLKDSDASTKRAFLKNPHGFLRARLTESIGTEHGDSRLESIEATYFETEGFSDRVSGIGAWQRPTLPWVQAQTQGWLPPEKIHIEIGSQRYEVLSPDLPEVLDQVESAIAQAVPNIHYREQSIPATDMAREALKSASDRLSVSATEFLTSRETAAVEQRRGPFALLAVDDFETGGYKAVKRPREFSFTDIPLLNNALKPHQEAGIRWLQSRWISGYRGALLADDMGLGKSLTILAFLLWLREQMRTGVASALPILIVVPTSLLQNWSNEHNTHLPGSGLGAPLIAYGRELSYYKNDSRRKDVDGGQPALRTELMRDRPWIITTYETLRDYQLSFGKIPFSVAVFDEAQRIKNPGASLKNAAKNMNADFFIAATGTPVENRLADLWSLVDLIEPDYLGPLRAFSRTYEASPSIEIIQELKRKVDHSVAFAADTTEIGDAGLMLRRMKDGTLRGLPEKREYPIQRQMPFIQAQAYDGAIERARGGGRLSRDVLLALQGILTISLHPDVTAAVSDEEYIGMSARYSAAFEILDRARTAKEKALIFLEMIAAQTPLALLIQRRYGLPTLPMIINGDVPAAQRQARVDAFQSAGGEFDVMILSPRAGGVGLTLTRANHVIHLSRWWNPAVEDQCTDRVYRIGQEKPVHVYYLQAIHPEYKEHSFDVKLHSLLERKRGLSRDLLSPPVCDETDIRDLYSQTVDSVSP